MIEQLLHLVEVAIWSSIAAVGFGILFNAPKKAISTIFALGFGAGFIKFLLIGLHLHIILASFLAALFVGIISMPMAHRIHKPPVVFSIPPIIPMIPGYYAYETVLSIMKFIFIETDPSKKIDLINAMFFNGFHMFFILISMTVGVSFPMLLLRKDSVKKITI
ncbi:MAG: threonine/serine exporter family protein [Flavobacteriaceae bacterium]|nr:threonine/serine exporter family protein [Flavobacteriaceae bacterium]